VQYRWLRALRRAAGRRRISLPGVVAIRTLKSKDEGRRSSLAAPARRSFGSSRSSRLAEAGAVASVGSRGDSYALAEAFNSLFKAELVRNKGPWKSIDDLEIAVAEYIDWFNHRRLHGEVGLAFAPVFVDPRELCEELRPAGRYTAHRGPTALSRR
jgi:transposase InsO family protein